MTQHNTDPVLHRHARIEQSWLYKVIRFVKRLMDDWHIDPIIGLVPYLGDAVSSIMTLPFLYLSAVKLHSYPLTMAILYNLLKDWLLGLIPFAVGDVIDFFNRSYHQSYRLIVGFVENDPNIIKEVHRKSAYTTAMLVLLSIAIYGMYMLSRWIFDQLAGLFS